MKKLIIIPIVFLMVYIFALPKDVTVTVKKNDTTFANLQTDNGSFVGDFILTLYPAAGYKFTPKFIWGLAENGMTVDNKLEPDGNSNKWVVKIKVAQEIAIFWKFFEGTMVKINQSNTVAGSSGTEEVPWRLELSGEGVELYHVTPKNVYLLANQTTFEGPSTAEAVLHDIDHNIVDFYDWHDKGSIIGKQSSFFCAQRLSDETPNF